MKVKKSILTLREFWVVESNLVSVLPVKENQLFEDISLDIDFDILEGEDNFKLILRIEGNKGKKKKIGYSFTIVSEGIFNFTKKIEEKETNSMLLFSALPMMIANVRGYLANISAYAPFGKYLLPSIDMKDLIENKQKMVSRFP